MSQWFYRRNGEKLGPVGSAQLRQLAAQGELSPADSIWREGLSDWIPARQVAGLFPTAASAGQQLRDANLPPTGNVAGPPSRAATASPASLASVRPSAAGPRPAATIPAEAEESAPMSNKEKRLLLLGIGAPALFAALFLGWFFGLRDTWEVNHFSEVIRLSDEAASAMQAKNPREGVKKYDELLQLVGDRKLVDADLAKAVATARAAVEPVRQQLLAAQRAEEKRQKDAAALAALQDLESQAKALVDAGDFERGMAKYQQALDSLRNGAPASPESTAAFARISQAKGAAAAALAKKQRALEAAQNRIEVEKTLANVKARIKGGAWLTKKSGSSEPLRGLKIYVLRGTATNEEFLTLLELTVARDRAEVARSKQEAAKWEAAVREKPDDAFSARQLSLSKEILESGERVLKFSEGKLASLSQEPATDSADMKTIFSYLASDANETEFSAWSAIVRRHLVETLHTDVDGKYSVEVSGGYYYLYAEFESAYSSVDWFVPANVTDAKDVAADLHNDTAAHIRNKKD